MFNLAISRTFTEKMECFLFDVEKFKIKNLNIYFATHETVQGLQTYIASKIR